MDSVYVCINRVMLRLKAKNTIICLIIISIFILSPCIYFYNIALSTNTFASPWLLPHILSDRFINYCIYFVIVLIFCDAPFVDEQYPSLVLRTGKVHWMRGILLSIILMSNIIFLFMWFCSVIYVFPIMKITTSWGSLISYLAFQVGVMSQNVVQIYAPLTAFSIFYVLFVLLACFIGFLNLLFNLWCRRPVGIYITSGFVAFDFFLYISFLDNEKYVNYISPVSWTNISRYGTANFPALYLSITLLLLINALIVRVIFIYINKRDILYKNAEF